MVGSKLLIIIPALNEEKSIAAVIGEVKTSLPEADIIVVNDGSRDATAKVAEAAGASVLDLPYNLGIGGAMQTGFKYARDGGYDIAVQVDADGQHDPGAIMALVASLAKDEADMVVGSRHLEDRGYRPSFARKFGMGLFSRVLSLIIGQPITDTTSGFRAINSRAIRFLADNYPTDYPEVEALVVCHYAGLRIKEIAVDMRVRETGESSITPWRAVYYMTKVTLAVLIWMIRKKPTLAGEEDSA